MTASALRGEGGTGDHPHYEDRDESALSKRLNDMNENGFCLHGLLDLSQVPAARFPEAAPFGNPANWIRCAAPSPVALRPRLAPGLPLSVLIRRRGRMRCFEP